MDDSGSRQSAEIPPMEIEGGDVCKARDDTNNRTPASKSRRGTATNWRWVVEMVKHTLRRKKSPRESTQKSHSPVSVDGGHAWSPATRRKSFTTEAEGRENRKGVGVFSFE